MENTQTIAQWQQFLQTLAPVEGWLYIGAGRGEVLRETRFAKVPWLLAVEAEQHASQLLAHAIASPSNKNSNWQAIHALVNNFDGPATWHQLSRIEESGLLPANILRALWPNIDEHQRAEQPAVSLSHLLEQTGDNQEHYNWLTIDCLPAARLLQGLGGTLEPLDMIEVRVALGGIAPHQTGTTLEECDELLLPQGFTRLALEEENNPLIGRALYGRDLKRQLTEVRKDHTELESQNDTLTLQRDELKAKNEAIQKECESTRNELENQKNQESQIREKLQQTQQDVTTLESQNNALTSQCDELKAKNEAILKECESTRNELEDQWRRKAQLNEKLQQVEAELKILRSQYDEIKKQLTQQGALSTLEKRMEYLFEQNTLQLEQATNALGRHVSATAKSTAKELEAGIALRLQHEGDVLALESKNSSLPSSVALAISNQLTAQPYDLIIEFGGGVATPFMAHALRSQSAQSRSGDISNDTQVSRYIDPSEDDLPKRIVCFEHNRKSCNQMQESLEVSGLAPLVSLQFSPLVPCTHRGKEHLFYDCTSRLQQIARLFEGRQARVFIFVNQTEGESQPEPLMALPQALQYLSAHTLDIVVNTQNRTDIAEQWQTTLNERGLDYQKIAEFGSQNTQLITVNP